ncbi:response regulator [Bradyrhizobium sp.]|uniref:response regulator n=1 Tax=Bradyrhizobium sp. TaxID=376 RepID=UPI003C4AEBB7
MPNELLVIEDTEVHLAILRKIGAKAGFTTTGADSVEGAATLLRRRTFDCITLDLSLGERSGREVIELLAELDCRAPILIISGSDDRARDDNVLVATSLGLVVYPPFPKPVDLVALRQTLQQIMADTDRQKLAKAIGRVSLLANQLKEL